MTLQLPTSTIGLRAQWLVDQISGSAEPATDADAAEAVSGDDPQGFLEWLRREAGGFTLERVDVDGDALLLYGTCARSRRHELHVTIEPDDGQKIGWVRHRRVLPDGMEARRAEESDNDAIVAICRSTPLALGDALVTIDPGPDYFAYVRLMENRLQFVATDQGRPVAVHSAAVYPAMIEGRRVRLAQVLHSRVLPGYTGIGLWSVMNRMAQDVGRETYDEWDDTPSDGEAERVIGCAYMAVDNESVHRLSGAQAIWSCRPYRVPLPCDELGREFRGSEARRATADDAEELVSIFNAAHEGEELFRPYTLTALTNRLERAPDLYTWSDVLLGEGAALGVWHAGQCRTTARGEDVSRSVRSLVLDYGFLPGREEELERLLRCAAADALARGHTHLSIFTSDPARGSALLRRLGDDIELYEFTTPAITEPPGAPENGVYVDQIYF